MAKLDDFGRPIYETAEEYNRAHKGGVCPRPYDSPEGENYQQNAEKKKPRYQSVAQRYATAQGSKKAMKTVIAIAVMVLSFNVALIFSMLGNIADDSDVYYEEEVQVFDEYLNNAITPLPEGFETFSHNGQTIILPTTFDEIIQMGFDLDGYNEEVLFPRKWEEMVPLYSEDGVVSVMVRVNNDMDEDFPMGKCIVDYFYIENLTIFNDIDVIPDFVFGNGLTFESTYEEVEAYFGTPYYHYADYSEEGYYYDQYQWSYYKEADERYDEVHFVQITFYNGVIESVSIEKKAYEEKYEM